MRRPTALSAAPTRQVRARRAAPHALPLIDCTGLAAAYSEQATIAQVMQKIDAFAQEEGRRPRMLARLRPRLASLTLCRSPRSARTATIAAPKCVAQRIACGHAD